MFFRRDLYFTRISPLDVKKSHYCTGDGGKASPAAADVEKILSSVGIEADTEKLKKVIAALSGKIIENLIAQGREKLSSMPSGAAAPAAAAGAAPAAAAADEKKEEKVAKKEESESEDEDMGFGLFD